MLEDNQGVTLNWMVCKIQSHPVVCGEQAGCLVLKHNPDVVHEWPSCTAINLCALILSCVCTQVVLQNPRF